MRHMLREVEVSFENLWAQVEKMKDIEKFSKDELNHALNTLTKQGWLIALGEDDKKSYRVNLRRKPGSNLSGSIWAALGDHMEKPSKEDPTEEE